MRIYFYWGVMFSVFSVAYGSSALSVNMDTTQHISVQFSLPDSGF